MGVDWYSCRSDSVQEILDKLKANLNKIREIATFNTKKNDKGETVVTLDDVYREEKEI